MELLTAYLAFRLLRVVELRMRSTWICQRNSPRHEAFGCNGVLEAVEYLSVWFAEVTCQLRLFALHSLPPNYRVEHNIHPFLDETKAWLSLGGRLICLAC
jgi:hypothetical protein